MFEKLLGSRRSGSDTQEDNEEGWKKLLKEVWSVNKRNIGVREWSSPSSFRNRTRLELTRIDYLFPSHLALHPQSLPQLPTSLPPLQTHPLSRRVPIALVTPFLLLFIKHSRPPLIVLTLPIPRNFVLTSQYQSALLLSCFGSRDCFFGRSEQPSRVSRPFSVCSGRRGFADEPLLLLTATGTCQECRNPSKFNSECCSSRRL